MNRTFLLAAALLLRSFPAMSASIISVGKPLTISSPVVGRVISFGAPVRIEAPVSGDVVSYGGDLTVTRGGEIGGDVVLFGARQNIRAGSVRGSVLTPGSLSAIYLAEMKRTPWQAGSGQRVEIWIGVRLLILALWLAGATLLLRFAASPISRAALGLEEAPGKCAATGLVTTVFLFLLGIGVFSLLPAVFGRAAAIAIVALAVALKVFGMAAVFLFLGQKITRRFSAGARPAALSVGLATAGAVSLLPWVGVLIWSALSMIAVGSAAHSRFGLPRFRVSLA